MIRGNEHNRKSRKSRTGSKAYRLGKWAEALSCLWLQLKGYRILDQRYKSTMGEIDIVAARGHTLVFVEVKARPDKTQAAGAVSYQQQMRLSRAAHFFLAQYPQYASFHTRFDVILVTPWRLPLHITNAFQVNV